MATVCHYTFSSSWEPAHVGSIHPVSGGKPEVTAISPTVDDVVIVLVSKGSTVRVPC